MIMNILQAILLVLVGSALFSIGKAIISAVLWLTAALGPEQSFEMSLQAIDGDSLYYYSNGQRVEIRLFGIDAPEWSQPEGPAAASAMKHLIENKTVTIKPKRTDKYGRLVAEVHLPDGTDAGQWMVQKGLAIAERRFSNKYIPDEEYARFNKIGFWENGGFITPADWRKANPRTER